MRNAIKLFIVTFTMFTAAAGMAYAQATPVLCPNGGQSGDFANCESPPILDFGNQGTSTTSTALTVTVNNCTSTYQIATGCTGSGTLTLGTPFAAISGTNSSDFAFTAGGSCFNGATVATRSSCTMTINFTPGSSGARTATLTVNYSGIASQTVSLTGTGVTDTTLSACGALSASTNYRLTGNVTANGTCFTFSGTNIDLNLNGFTVTYCNSGNPCDPSAPVNAVQLTASGGVITVHNGKIVQGAGTPTFIGTYGGSGPVGNNTGTTSPFWNSTSNFFNLTMTYAAPGASTIFTPGTGGNGDTVVHDVIINDNAVGVCNTIACRQYMQSAGGVNAPNMRSGNTTHWYNNVQNGGPQGGWRTDEGSVSATIGSNPCHIDHNYINPGNATNTNSNNFGVWNFGSCEVNANIIEQPINTTTSSARGIILSDATANGYVARYVHQNYIGGFQLANNLEYSGCPIGGAYGIQIDDKPTAPNQANNNTSVVGATACGAVGLRFTDNENTGNISKNNSFTVQRLTGASACTYFLDADSDSPGCAAGFAVDSAQGGTSQSDSFTADSAMVFVGPDGAGCPVLNADGYHCNPTTKGIILQSPTFTKGSNPSSAFHTFVMRNGNSGTIGTCSNGGACVVQGFFINDATFNTGTSATDTDIPTQGGSQRAVSLYIQWTQTIGAIGATNGWFIVGATVTFTDTLGHAYYTCTTDSTGHCSVPVPQYRLHNDTAANQIETRNPYQLSVSASGCTTNTQTGLTYTATGSANVTLSGCSGTVPGSANVYIAQTSLGTGDGSSCANALALTYLNTAGNWVAGNTYHLCGTLSFAAASPAIKVLGSGTSGAPINVVFETGAKVQAPYFGGNPITTCSGTCGGIDTNGQSYIVIDGKSTGIVQNTANGSSLANQQNSMGVHISAASNNIIVRNLTIQNIYNNTSAEPNTQPGFNTNGIRLEGGPQNVEICNNQVTDMHSGMGIQSSWNGPRVEGPTTCNDSTAATGINIYNNTISDVGWGSNFGGSGYINFYRNIITNWNNWFFPTNISFAYHLDGIIAFAGSGQQVKPYIYSNWIHGDQGGGDSSGFIYCSHDGTNDTSGSACTIYNNLLVIDNPSSQQQTIVTFYQNDSGGAHQLGPHYFYNNTVIGGLAGGTGPIYYGSGSATLNVQLTFYNNIVGPFGGWVLQFNNQPIANVTSDYNDFWGGRNFGTNAGAYGIANVNNTFAQWQAIPFDTNGIESNPNLNSTYQIQTTGSSAYNRGTNLSSLSITSLNCDKPLAVGYGNVSSPCNSRTTRWDAGAYQFTGTPAVATPTFSPGAGIYTSAIYVTISTVTAGSTILYSTTGTAVDGGSCTAGAGTIAAVSPATIVVSVSSTVSALACQTGFTDSGLASATYTLNITPYAPATTIFSGLVSANGDNKGSN